MDFLSIIKTRRSIRSFQEKKVSQEIIKKAIEVATCAPSACNVQGWRFIVVDDKRKKQRITDMGASVNIEKAPMGILVLYDNRTKNTEYADYIQSAAAAIQNLLLAIHYFGLGACWTCHLPSKNKLRKLFKIPSYFSPIAYVIIGYPAKKPIEVPRRYQVETLISYNIFSSNIPIEKISKLKIFVQKIIIKIYHLVPLFLKKKFLNKYLDKRFVKKFDN